jgi:hypothetical protein
MPRTRCQSRNEYDQASYFIRLRRIKEDKNTEILNHLATRISYDEYLQKNLPRLLNIATHNRFSIPKFDDALFEYVANSEGLNHILVLEYLTLKK